MRTLAVLTGLAFGALLHLSGMADYDVIHDGLLFRSPHLYLMMAATIATGAPLLALLRRRGITTPMGGPLEVLRERIEPKHVSGGMLFGFGWAVAGTCPGAAAAMVAGGRWQGLFVMAGIVVGVGLRDHVEATRSAPSAPPVSVPAAG